MPSITLGTKKFGSIKAADGRYVGDCPPAGAYRVVSGKTWIVKETGPNSQEPGTTMLTVPLQISGEKGRKAKYNGYTIWHNLTLGETSIPFVNMFLEAAGIDPAKFHGAKAKTDAKGNITAVQGVTIGGNVLMVATKVSNYDPKNPKLEVSSSAKFVESDEADADEDDDFDDDEAVLGEDSDDDDDDEKFDKSDDDDDSF